MLFSMILGCFDLFGVDSQDREVDLTDFQVSNGQIMEAYLESAPLFLFHFFISWF